MTEDKTESRKTHKQAATESVCSEVLAKRHQRENSESADVPGLHTSGFHQIFIPVLNILVTFTIISLCPNMFEPMETEELC